MEGLPSEKKKSFDESNSKITLTSCIAWIWSYMEDNRMETVFRVYDPDLKYEFYLLDDWRTARYGKLSKWFHNLSTMGVLDGTGNYLPVFNFDCDNLDWIRKDMLASITL